MVHRPTSACVIVEYVGTYLEHLQSSFHGNDGVRLLSLLPRKPFLTITAQSLSTSCFQLASSTLHDPRRLCKTFFVLVTDTPLNASTPRFLPFVFLPFLNQHLPSPLLHSKYLTFSPLLNAYTHPISLPDP